MELNNNSGLQLCGFIERVGCLFFLLVWLSCSNNRNSNVFPTDGLPYTSVGESMHYSSMVFMNDTLGYLFGTLSRNSHKTCENYIFQTDDGVHNWKLVSCFSNGKTLISGEVVDDNQGNLYRLLRNLSEESDYVERYSMADGKVVLRKQFQSRASLIGAYKGLLYVLVNIDNQDRINVYNENLEVQHSYPAFPFYNGLVFEHKLYCLSANQDNGESDLCRLDKDGHELICLPLDPGALTLWGNELLIMGDKKNEERIYVASYDVESNKSVLLSSFDGYSIIRFLESNNNHVIAVLGKDPFSGDFFYSNDGGKTWSKYALPHYAFIDAITLIQDKAMIIYDADEFEKIDLI